MQRFFPGFCRPGGLRLLPFALAAGAVALFYALGYHHLVNWNELVDQREVLQAAAVSRPVGSALAFMGVYVAIAMLSLPFATILSIFGGLIFGFVPAMILVPVAATLGASGAFMIARGLAESLKQVLPKRMIALFEAGFSRHAFSYLLALRLAPFFPFPLVNMAAAFCRVPLPLFMAATYLGILPGSLLYVWLGSGLEDALRAAEARGDDYALSDCLTPEVGTALVALGIFAAVPLLLRPLIAKRLFPAALPGEREP